MAEGACVAGGHAGQGAYMAGGCAWQGVCMARGHAWQEVCVAGGGHAWQILRDTVNERTVRILLECILVYNICS